ncbi:MAG: DUF1573 domain-containing protein [Prevotellaceae bacterium]|nr:DUF1573 domain-containing protein [Prevotellaceae bacterium]
MKAIKRIIGDKRKSLEAFSYIFTTTAAFLFLTSCNDKGQTTYSKTNTQQSISIDTINKGSIISYKQYKFDFDTINVAEGATCVFHYCNIGQEPLIISDILTSCGCIENIWHKEPLAINQSDSVVIKYKSNTLGTFQKAVVVKNNSINEPILTIRIEGYVEK